MVTSFQHEIFVPQSGTSTSFGTADGWPPSRADEAGMSTGRRPFLNGGLMKVSRTTRSGSCERLMTNANACRNFLTPTQNGSAMYSTMRSSFKKAPMNRTLCACRLILITRGVLTPSFENWL